jgi:hypothetical protein
VEGVCWITAMRLRVVSGPVTSLNSAIDPGQPWVMISYGTGQFSLFLDSDTIMSVGSDLRQAFPLESVLW